MFRNWLLRVTSAVLESVAALAAVAAPVPSHPNFIFILGEGHGWTSTSVRMDDRVPESKGPKGLTPNLEKLAREGMRFSDFYAASPRCTPSRVSLLTGISPARLHMTYQNEGGKAKQGRREDSGSRTGQPSNTRLLCPQPVTELPNDIKTVGDILQGAGYVTAHFGKWHVGRISPAQHGFDETDGPTTNAAPGENRTPNPKEAYAITDRGIAFIERQVRAGKPFYLQISHYGGGSTAEVKPETLKEVAARLGNVREKELCQAGIVADLDGTIGQITRKVDELGIAHNTYVIYSADHGSPGLNPPLSGGKGSVLDGGLRVPFIIRGPDIRPGTVSHVRAIGWDLTPTLAVLAGVEQALPTEIEGGSLAPVLGGGGVGVVRRPGEAIVVHFPHYDLQNGGPASAIWLGNFKLIRSYETSTSSLYDLSRDYAEHHDLAKEMPERVRDLDHRLTECLKSKNAQMPTPNPGYDSTRPSETQRNLKEQRDGTQNRQRGNQDRTAGKARQPAQDSACIDVPPHPFDLVLGRPTRDSITASVLAYEDMEGFIAYGTRQGDYANKTPVHQFRNGQPVELVVRSLRPNARYYYRFHSRKGRSGAFTTGPECTFHTHRPPGSEFIFTVTADSHLDENTDCGLYAQTLANALADHPDFQLDLGDTFMSEKHASREQAARQYLAQRYYFGIVGHSAPLFLAIGNHDGENGRWLDGTADNLAVWSNTMRKRYFPNPVPEGFYRGDLVTDRFAGLLQDYYAWEWGNALFVVLDPFWFTPRQRGRDDGWTRTLGDVQYQWLKRALEQSKAKFKFLFIHHLVGGLDKDARGGTEAAKLYEWGGRNADGTVGFKDRRPDWPAPIHELLVRNMVSIVFHGHDHMFAKQDLDGVVYQEVPQPGHLGKDNRLAREYGYQSGVVLGGSGHLRVAVSGEKTTVDYVQACLSSNNVERNKNGAVAHGYSISALTGRHE